MKTTKTKASSAEGAEPEKKAKETKKCSVCDKSLTKGNFISGNGGNTLICKNCFSKLI